MCEKECIGQAQRLVAAPLCCHGSPQQCMLHSRRMGAALPSGAVGKIEIRTRERTVGYVKDPASVVGESEMSRSRGGRYCLAIL